MNRPLHRLVTIKMPPGYLAAVRLLCWHENITDISLLIRLIDSAPPPSLQSLDRFALQDWILQLSVEIEDRLDQAVIRFGGDRTHYLASAIRVFVDGLGKPFPEGIPAMEARHWIGRWSDAA
jgi:hypothetical protein